MERYPAKRSRSESRSPPPWRRQSKSPRVENDRFKERSYGHPGRGRGRGNFMNHHQRRNQEQEDRQMREWMSQEDDFVLKQSKKKARIRIKENRATTIDKLVLMLSILDPNKDLLDDESDDLDFVLKDPTILIEALALEQLKDLEKDIQHYLVLEHNEVNQSYWDALRVVCKYRIQELSGSSSGRGMGLVSSDVGRLLGPKTLSQLQVLESQVHQKLSSDEAIDEEYWEQLLESIILYKAKAQLKDFLTSLNQAQLNAYRDQQITLAHQRVAAINGHTVNSKQVTEHIASAYPGDLDPMPQLKMRQEDQGMEIISEQDFQDRVNSTRQRAATAGYIPANNHLSKSAPIQMAKSLKETVSAPEDYYSSTTDAMYDREAAKGVEEDEEVFAGEEQVQDVSKPLWSGKYRPRKPKHFNRVQMGYEWNKYNQTHYDHDNPPPKVVQGYKFNVFYPDLIDKNKAPTYRIERENGRKKGQSLAPAGEEDTCLIRFIGGPPYEDIAFRIVDREWDYSAKRERGFKSSFDKGILQLHFQFKKIYYRK